jgi:hypothetical protein
VLAADKGYDSKEKRAALGKRGINHNGLSAFGRKRKIGVDQFKSQFHVFSRNVVSRGSSENTAGLLFDGNEFPLASMLLFL